MLAAICLLALVVVVVVRSAGGGGGSSHKLTICESAWQEAQRSADETGAQHSNQVVLQPTLTACDNVAEWDAANIRAHSPIAEGAAVVRNLCAQLRVTNTPLCTEATREAPPPSP